MTATNESSPAAGSVGEFALELSDSTADEAADRQAHGDDSTRYLCAAMHLDGRLANTAIQEFLAEPARAMPPSPGVRTRAVLRAAIAARRRRQWRDITLTALLVLYALIGLPALALWFSLGVLWSWLRAGRRRVDDGRRPVLISRGWLVSAVLVGLLVLAVVAAVIPGTLLLGSMADSRSYGSSHLGNGYPEGIGVVDVLGAVVLWGYVLLPLLMFAVLLADRLVVWLLVTRTYQVFPESWHGDDLVRQLGSGEHLAGLDRVEQAEARQLAGERSGPAEDDGFGSAEVVVYRGMNPFVGSGRWYRAWSFAIPLERTGKPAESGGEPADIRVADLYRDISGEIDELRESASLSPSLRFRGLRRHDQVLVSADSLVRRRFAGDHADQELARAILPVLDLRHPPRPTLDPELTTSLAERPVEWARYFRRFQVESWDRAITISVYLHIARDDRTLFVEWIPCVLYPVGLRYQAIDELRRNPVHAVPDAIGSLWTLPKTIVPRAFHAMRPIRSEAGRSNSIPARVYGSYLSLREMTCDDGPQEYLQSADVERYLKILQRRCQRALGRSLEKAGLTTTEFMAQASAVNQTFNFMGNTMSGAMAFGSDSRVVGNTVGGPSFGGGVTPPGTSQK